MMMNSLQERDWAVRYSASGNQWIQQAYEQAVAAGAATGAGADGSALAAYGQFRVAPDASAAHSALDEYGYGETNARALPAPTGFGESTAKPLPATKAEPAATDSPPASPSAVQTPGAVLPTVEEATATSLPRSGKPETVVGGSTSGPHARSTEEWNEIRACWNANNKADPYRIYQQMSEHGWDDSDIAYATGQSVQAVGDYLTRIGAEAGFGGSATAGRDVIDAFQAALDSAQSKPDPSLPFVHTYVTYNESGWMARDDATDSVVQYEVDLPAFTQWYVAQDTDAARAFARIQGNLSGDGAGGVNFAGGAHVGLVVDESAAAGTVRLTWPTDPRIGAYQSYAKGDPLQRAAMAEMVQSPLNDQIIQTFGNPTRELPGNELGERMRALYGTDLATYMLRLQDAVAAMKARYVADLDSALSQAVPRGALGVSQVYLDSSGNQVFTSQPGHTDSISAYFDLAAFQRQYASRGAAEKLITEAFGSDVIDVGDDGFRTAGTTDQLHISLVTDESGTLQVHDATLLGQNLANINIGDPPDLRDGSAVWFAPMAGFVTPIQNIKPEEDWLDEVVPVVIIAAVSYISGGSLGPAAASAMGLAEGTLGFAVASAAVASTVTSAVSGMLNDNLSFKSILRGALSSVLTAGLLRGLDVVAGPQLAALDKAGVVLANATVQGTVQALMGGSFKDGALNGFAASLAAVVGGSVNNSIAEALKNGTMTSAEAATARYFSAALSASIKIVARGEGDAGYAYAKAFLDTTFAEVGGAAASVAAPNQTAAEDARLARNERQISEPEYAVPASRAASPGLVDPSSGAVAYPVGNGGPSTNTVGPEWVSDMTRRDDSNNIVQRTIYAGDTTLLEYRSDTPGQFTLTAGPNQTLVRDASGGLQLVSWDVAKRGNYEVIVPPGQTLCSNGAQGVLTPNGASSDSSLLASLMTLPLATAGANGAAEILGGGATLGELLQGGRLAVPDIALGTLGRTLGGIGLALYSPALGGGETIVDINDSTRIVKPTSDVIRGYLEVRDASTGEWMRVGERQFDPSDVLAAIRAQRTTLLSPDEIARLQAPAIYTPPPSLPPVPGYAPTPDTRDSATPGYEASDPAVPETDGRPIETPDWRDSIVNSNPDGNPRKPEYVPSRTSPTGGLGGVPAGDITPNPNGERGIDRENKAADALANAGYRVVQNPVLTAEQRSAAGIAPTAKPDLLVEGKVFDVKSPVSAAAAETAISDSIDGRQARRFVINAIDFADPDAGARELAARLADHPVEGLQEVKVLVDGVIRNIYP